MNLFAEIKKLVQKHGYWIELDNDFVCGAYTEYSNALNKRICELTSAEKKVALFNHVIEKGR